MTFITDFINALRYGPAGKPQPTPVVAPPQPLAWVKKPNSIEVKGNFVMIYGDYPEENEVSIGLQPSPNPETKDFTDNFCIVTDLGGDLERYEASPQGLTSALSELHYADDEYKQYDKTV